MTRKPLQYSFSSVGRHAVAVTFAVATATALTVAPSTFTGASQHVTVTSSVERCYWGPGGYIVCED